MNQSQQSVYRILDASGNRAAEGIRTIEEYARFVLNDAPMAESAKQLRHALASCLRKLPREKLLIARDTPGDVGTAIQTSSEYERPSGISVVSAAAARVQQSLRVLEEYGKTIDADFSRSIEPVRYQAYTLFRDIELRVLIDPRRDRLKQAKLYLLIEALEDNETFASSLRELAEAGVDLFQLRDKTANDQTLLQRATIGARVARECGSLLIVNDRADIAVAAQADGVHLGQTELPAKEARKIVGDSALIGISTHSMQQVHNAIQDGADYIGCGPTFSSRTKSFEDYPGTDFLREVHEGTKRTPRPAFAIGGIDESNVAQVQASGFHRIAVTAAIHQADDPIAVARRLKALLDADSK